jgi:signal transduction histidine kinase
MRTPILLIRLVGLLLCGVSVLLALNQPSQQASTLLTVLLPHLSAGSLAIWSVATPIVIGITFWYCTSFREFENSLKRTSGLLVIQTLLALLIAPELQFIVSMEAGLLLSPRSGGIWVFTQAALIWLSSAVYPQLMSWVLPATDDRLHRLVAIGLFMLLAMLYNFFAFALGWLSATGRRQAQALDMTIRSLEQTNRELTAAQQAAAENARLNERLTIARELHDAVGHQLTALSVDLQVATHLSHDDAQPHVKQAYQLTRQLLAEVRDVVSAVRNPSSPDFASALRAFTCRLEEPKVHLSLESLPESFDPEFSHALLRCSQEIITNAVRHAKARNLWLETSCVGDQYELRARDDGRGDTTCVPGNGLNGIVERIRQFQGTVHFETHPRQGFQVSIKVPLERKGSGCAPPDKQGTPTLLGRGA